MATMVLKRALDKDDRLIHFKHGVRAQNNPNFRQILPMSTACAFREAGLTARKLHARKSALVAEKLKVGLGGLGEVEQARGKRSRCANGKKVELGIEIATAFDDFLFEFLREYKELRIDRIGEICDFAGNESVVQGHGNRSDALNRQIDGDKLDTVLHEIGYLVACFHASIAKRTAICKPRYPAAHTFG